MDELSPFLVSEDSGTLRIAWDYGRVPKDRIALGCFMIFSIIWVSLTLAVTCAIFLPGMDNDDRWLFAICSIFGWLCTLAISYGWVATTWSEWIEISHDSFSNGKIGFLVLKLRRKKT